MANIYVCYSNDDNNHRNAFAGMMLNPNTNIKHFPVIDKKNMRPQGKEAVKEYILSLMKECAAVAVLVGNNTHSAPVVKWEIEVANAQQKPFIVVRIEGTSGGAPSLIKDIPETKWNPNEIDKALRNVLGS